MRELTRKRKVFVLSLHRCGTTSTTTLLEKADYNCGHWINSFSKLDLQRQVEGREEDLLYVFKVLEPAIEHYDALSDVPIPALYGELYDHYPDGEVHINDQRPY